MNNAHNTTCNSIQSTYLPLSAPFHTRLSPQHLGVSVAQTSLAAGRGLRAVSIELIVVIIFVMVIIVFVVVLVVIQVYQVHYSRDYATFSIHFNIYHAISSCTYVLVIFIAALSPWWVGGSVQLLLVIVIGLVVSGSSLPSIPLQLPLLSL